MKRRPRREDGYALLTVLFLAAVVVIMLALALPRQAFEAQRAKEDVLIYRGSQYARAIQLYFRKFHKYPAKIEDLENTNNVRFLRRKFDDPITKKDEWRIIHIGGAGAFTDSLVYDKLKKDGADGQNGNPGRPAAPGDPAGTSVAAVPGMPGPPAGVADRLRRQGGGVDQNGNPGAAGDAGAEEPITPDPNQPGQPAYMNAANPGQGNPAPGMPGFPGRPGFPGSYPGSQMGPGNFQQPNSGPGGQSNPGFGNSGFGAQPNSGFGGQGNSGFGSQNGNSGFGGNQGFGGGQGFSGAGNFPQQGNQGGNAGGFGGPMVGGPGASVIGQMLTSPRGSVSAPGANGAQMVGNNAGGGLFGSSPDQQGNTAFGNAGAGFGAGIAGVASKSEERGLKVYKDQETYNKWEFVYDYRKDPSLTGGGAAGPGNMPGANMPNQPGQAGANGAFGQSAFGRPGQPGQSGFGQPGTTGFGGGPGQSGQPGFGQPGQAPVNPAQPGLGPGTIALPTPAPIPNQNQQPPDLPPQPPPTLPELAPPPDQQQ